VVVPVAVMPMIPVTGRGRAGQGCERHQRGERQAEGYGFRLSPE